MAHDSIVVDFLRREFDADQTLTPETRLLAEGIVDSVGIFVFVEFLESQFDISLKDTDITIENFETVTSIMALVKARQP